MRLGPSQVRRFGTVADVGYYAQPRSKIQNIDSIQFLGALGATKCRHGSHQSLPPEALAQNRLTIVLRLCCQTLR